MDNNLFLIIIYESWEKENVYKAKEVYELGIIFGKKWILLIIGAMDYEAKLINHFA